MAWKSIKRSSFVVSNLQQIFRTPKQTLKDTCNLTQVVGPREEQNASVVFLPVRYDECQHDTNFYDEQILSFHGIIGTTEDWKHPHRHKQGCKAVQPVVKQLSQGTARFGSASLLSIGTICCKEIKRSMINEPAAIYRRYCAHNTLFQQTGHGCQPTRLEKKTTAIFCDKTEFLVTQECGQPTIDFFTRTRKLKINPSPIRHPFPSTLEVKLVLHRQVLSRKGESHLL